MKLSSENFLIIILASLLILIIKKGFAISNLNYQPLQPFFLTSIGIFLIIIGVNSYHKNKNKLQQNNFTDDSILNVILGIIIITIQLNALKII